MRPSSGAASPLRMFLRVDLPAPFSPTSMTTSPGRTARLTARSTRTPAKLLPTPCTSSRSPSTPAGISSLAAAAAVTAFPDPASGRSRRLSGRGPACQPAVIPPPKPAPTAPAGHGLPLLHGRQAHEAAVRPARLEGREHEGHPARPVPDRRAQALAAGGRTVGLQEIGDLGVEVGERLQVSLRVTGGHARRRVGGGAGLEAAPGQDPRLPAGRRGPQAVRVLLVPRQAATAAVDTEARAVLVARRDRGVPQVAPRPVVEAQVHRGVVLEP